MGGSVQPDDFAELWFPLCLWVFADVVLSVEEMLIEHDSRGTVQGDEVMWLHGDY